MNKADELLRILRTIASGDYNEAIKEQYADAEAKLTMPEQLDILEQSLSAFHCMQMLTLHTMASLMHARVCELLTDAEKQRLDTAYQGFKRSIDCLSEQRAKLK